MSKPNELPHLTKWLRGAGRIESAAVIGSPVAAAANAVRAALTGAHLFLVVQNAKELDALQGTPIRDVSAVTGTDFDALDRSVRAAILIVTGFEGKDTIRRRLQSATRRLDPGGTMVVFTHTKRGANGQLAMLRETFGNGDVAGRGGGGVRVLTATAGAHARTSADTAPREPDIRETILGVPFAFATDAAVFSRDRIDAGTRLLLEALPAMSPRSILDFGCGYGVMGIVLAQRFPLSRVTMVDIDLTAVDLAATNARVPDARFDLAVLHFPLHIPRPEVAGLLIEIRDALEPGACLYGVMLNAYELRPLVEDVFGNVETLEAGGAGREYSIVRACRR
jgi:16S rRNA (guanine1207-N2)-methyltransferase